jgi:hypothetical protein
MRLPNGIRIAGSFDHLALDDQARQLESLSETKADFPAADLVRPPHVFNIKDKFLSAARQSELSDPTAPSTTTRSGRNERCTKRRQSCFARLLSRVLPSPFAPTIERYEDERYGQAECAALTKIWPPRWGTAALRRADIAKVIGSRRYSARFAKAGQ